RLLRSLDLISETHTTVDVRARQLIRATTLLAYALAAVAGISFALSRLGISEPRWTSREMSRWLLTHGINIVIIVVGAWAAMRAAALAIEHLQYRFGGHHSGGDLEWQRRAATRSGVLTSMVTVSIGFVAMLMLLRELSIDVLPLLTGAGIAGLAIGFGAQNL